MSATLENLRKDIRMRTETDRVVSTGWLVIIFIPSILGMIFVLSIFMAPMGMIGLAALAAMAFLLWIPSIIGLIFLVILLYKLIKRRNTHFRRQSLLFEDIVNAVRDLAGRKGVDVELHLNSCERVIREAKAEETEKNAVLWVILSLITGIAILYVYYFLMKDFYRHERREDFFWEDIGKALNTCGITTPLPRRMAPLPDRSFALYLILSIITLGIFGIYWLYTLIKDPNEHFKYHTLVEDELLKQLEAAITKES